MKKYIFLLLSAVVAFCGCEGAKSDASITLVQTSKDEINVSGDGAKVKVGFASALDWYVETPDEWITVTPDKGAAGNALITVQVDKNLETEERTGVVNICSDDLVFPVRVIQKPYEATFEIFEDHKYVSCLGGEVTIRINTDIDFEFSIDADWLKSAESKVASVKEVVLYAEPNPLEEQRSAVVTFQAYGRTCEVTVTQLAAGTEADDWQFASFVHRSLAMRFTATWCGYCPYMGTAFKTAKSQMSGSLELVSLHGGDSNYEFFGTTTLGNRYRISGYPTGIVDGRVSIPNYSSTSTTAEVTVNAIKETIENYPTTAGIACSSSIDGNTLSVDVSLYLKKADSYRLTILLLEDDITGYQNGAGMGYDHDDVARLAVTSISGETIKTDSPSVWTNTYTATLNDKWNKDNLRLLFYVERTYGEHPKVEGVEGAEYGNYGEYYVDNCRAVEVGVAAELEVL